MGRWTADELLAFNIEVKNATTASFFDTTDLPVPPAFETVLNNLEEPNGPVSKPDSIFFRYLKIADSDETAGHDFAAYLLDFLDYNCGYRYLRKNKAISFYKAGQLAKDKADVALMDDGFLLLLVQEGKVNFSSFSVVSSYS